MEQKAILEIDLPNSCSECPLCADGEGGCVLLGDCIDDYTTRRHVFCPLKPKRTRPVETEEEKQTKLYNAKKVLSMRNRATLQKVITANGDCEYDKELYQAIEDVLGELRFRSDNHSALYVIDLESKDRRIHRIGSEVHDAMSVYDWDGKREIHYRNMQCGDGGTVEQRKGYGYVILQSEDGYLTNEYGKIIDRRFVKEIKQFLKEEYGQEVDE